MSARFYWDNQKQFLSFFGPGAGKRLLDAGCKHGSFTMKIAEAAGADEVHAIEIDDDNIKAAAGRGIKVKRSDLNCRFPYPDSSFDVLSANQVLEHLWNTKGFFMEANRVLKKGGYAVISVPNMSSLHSILFILMGQQTPVVHLVDRQVGNFLRGVEVGEHGHVKAFNVPALEDLAELYGFEVEGIRGSGIYFFPSVLQGLAARILKKYAVFLTVRMRKVRDLGQ